MHILISNTNMNCCFHIYRSLSSDDYMKLVLTTLADFPGTLIAIFVVDKIGRKVTMTFMGFLTAAFTFILPQVSFRIQHL